MDEPVGGVAERDEAAAQEDWALLQTVTERLNAAQSREETLRTFLLAAPRPELAEASLCTIDVDADGKPTWLTVALVQAGEGRQPQAHVGARYYLPDLPFSRVYLERPGVPVMVGSLATDPRLDSAARAVWDGLGLKATILIALTLRGRVVGLFALQWSCEVALGERERRIFQVLSRNAALLLENMVMVDKLRASLTETQQQQRLLATVHEHVPIGILCLEAKTLAPLIINQAARSILRGERPEARGEAPTTATVRALYPGTDAPVPEHELPIQRAATTGEIQRAELDLLAHDGGRRTVESTCVPVRNAEGEVERLVLVMVDVTGRKQATAEREQLQAQVIAAQARALAERSSPLIPITDDVLVMPLVGTIDPERGRQILETALSGTRAVAARVTILDITGVPQLDLRGAEALAQTARALQLLGVLPVLSGVRAEVAQALVALDDPLTGIVTCGTLQSGVEYALRRLGKKF